MILNFLKVWTKTDSKDKNKYFKLFLYGIIIVTKDTYIYMRQSKQNQIIYFFPDPQIGGVEKNFFLVSKYLSTFFKQNFLITGNQINNKIDKRIKLIKISNIWSNINRRLLFIICSRKLFLVSAKMKNSIIFSFQGNFYAIIVSILLRKKIIIRSNLSPQGWANSTFKINTS